MPSFALVFANRAELSTLTSNVSDAMYKETHTHTHIYIYICVYIYIIKYVSFKNIKQQK